MSKDIRQILTKDTVSSKTKGFLFPMLLALFVYQNLGLASPMVQAALDLFVKVLLLAIIFLYLWLLVLIVTDKT